MIVTKDADVETAVDTLTVAKFGSAVQSCGAPSRFIVHEQLDETDSGTPRRAESLRPIQAGQAVLDALTGVEGA